MRKLIATLMVALTIGLQAQTVTATAYTSTHRQTDSSPCISATNKNICKLHSKGVRIIAVSRNLERLGYRMGKHVLIRGKRYLITDRMNKRFTNRIDFYMGRNHRAAMKWGIRKVNIKLID